MLTRLFKVGDEAVDEFAALLTKLGTGGVLIWCVMIYSAYWTIGLVRFVMR